MSGEEKMIGKTIEKIDVGGGVTIKFTDGSAYVWVETDENTLLDDFFDDWHEAMEADIKVEYPDPRRRTLPHFLPTTPEADEGVFQYETEAALNGRIRLREWWTQ